MKFSSLAANGDRLYSQAQYTSENRKLKCALSQFCLPLNRHMPQAYRPCICSHMHLLELGFHPVYKIIQHQPQVCLLRLSLQLSVSTLDFDSCSCYLLRWSCVAFQITSSLEFLFCTPYLYFKHVIPSHVFLCITFSAFLLPKLQANRSSVRRDGKRMS